MKRNAKTTRLIPLFVLALLASISHAQLEWDPSTLRLVAEDAIYARMARTPNNNILCVFEQASEVRIARSSDNGMSWDPPKTIITYPHGTPANPELLVPNDERILLVYNERPSKSDHHYTIMMSLSEDNANTWSPPRELYRAATTFENGCWEPMPIQLRNDDIHIYFANENPYRDSNEQEISVLVSHDLAMSFDPARTVCFRPNHRDGMPVAAVLHSGIIAVAIEDNGISGNRFKPAIVTSDDNWETSPVQIDSPYRYPALHTPLEPSQTGAAPYLVATEDATFLSAQVFASDSTQPMMTVWIGNKDAQDFQDPSTPFAPDPGAGCYWNALFMKTPNTITAIAHTTIKNKRGIWAIDAPINLRKPDAPKALQHP